MHNVFCLPRSTDRRQGWSLAEMLVVITIVGFLLAMSAPNLFSLLRANELSTQGEVMRNWLSQAQQQALSTGSDVEVRFYAFADLANAQTEAEFRACQYFQYDSLGQLQPKSEVYRINDPVLLSRTLSTMLDSSKRGLSTGTADGVQLFGNDLMQNAVTFRSFRFRPDGSTDLPKNEQWYFTLIQDEGGNPQPKNFFCIQVDPYNGSLREYRP